MKIFSISIKILLTLLKHFELCIYDAKCIKHQEKLKKNKGLKIQMDLLITTRKKIQWHLKNRQINRLNIKQDQAVPLHRV